MATVRLLGFYFAIPIVLAVVVLAFVLVGIFIALAMKTWGGFFFIRGLAMSGTFLFLVYLLVSIMMRQYHDQ